jgi:general bacterial porin, GBP family
MKKTVLALAAIAASSAAFAQSSVTLSGVVDASVESVKGDHSVTRVSSDDLASSRIVFKGVEDLGGGLKATFLLDSSLKTDTGAADSSRFFGRSAYVGLTGGFGEVRLGRQDSLIGGQTAAAIGTQGYDEAVIAQTLGGVAYRRIDNAVTYFAPAFVPGLTLAAQYSTAVGVNATNAENAYGNNTDRAYGFLANYANGPISGGLSYIQVNTDAAGDIENTGWFVYGAYDFGAAKLTAYFNQDDQDGAKDDRRTFGLRVAVPVAQAVTVSAGYARVEGANASSTTFNAKGTKDDTASILTLKAQYDLSKRTALYALYSQVYNDNNTALKVGGSNGVTTGLDKSSRGLAVGVRHSF